MRHLCTLLCGLFLMGMSVGTAHAQCAYTLYLTDAGGDGWDVQVGTAASVDFYRNNVYESTYTFIDGNLDEVLVMFTEGDILRFEYIPASGSMDATQSNSDNCLMVRDADGIFLAAQAGSTSMVTVEVTASCTAPPATCVYYAELFDAGADTWDGALLKVAIGPDTLDFTISNAQLFYTLFPFYAADDVSIRLDYTQADNDNEDNAYCLLDEQQKAIYCSGNNPLAGMPLFHEDVDCNDTCSVVCPGDTIINLGPQACDIAYEYDIELEGPCAWPADTFCGFSGLFGPANAMVDDSEGGSVDFSGAPDTLTIISPDEDQLQEVQTSVTWVVHKDGMLSFDWHYFTFDQVFSDYLLTVQSGQMDSVLTDTYNIFDLEQSGTFMTELAAGDSITVAMVSIDGLLGPAITDIFNLKYITEELPSDLVLLEGLASGELFPIDTTVVTWQVTDFSGNVSTCSFNVIVNENPNETDDLVCRQDIQVSLGSDCSYTLQLLDVLVPGDSTGCLDDFDFYFEDNGMNIGKVVDGNYVGEMLNVKVVDTVSTNACWGTALIEDKLKPTISCSDITVLCTNVDNLPDPIFDDNCDDDPTLILLDSFFVAMPCDTNYSGTISRWFTVEDASGNRSDSCTQNIVVERIGIENVTFPDDLLGIEDNALSCDSLWYIIDGGDTVPNPAISGYPMLGNMVLDNPGAMQLCGLNVTFVDSEDPGSNDCLRKFTRTWTVEDANCPTPVLREVGQQLIQVADTVPPSITCPPDFVFPGVMVNCEADVYLPPAQVSDNCGGVNYVDIFLDVPPYFIHNSNGDTTVTLPAGVNNIRYRVYDNCGLWAECDYDVTVVDGVQPVPICKPGLVVSLTEDGTATVDAETFDSGSTDECGVDSFAVARMFPGCNGDDDLFGPEIVFGCCDMAENPIMVILKVLDAAGNENSCMVEVEVQDKINPLYQCPPPVTISCEFPIDTGNLDIFGEIVLLDDPNSIYNPGTDPRNDVVINDPGNPNSPTNFGKEGWVYDNCAVSFTESYTLNLDDCNTGELVRTFTFRNGADMVVGQCSQVITITNFTPFNPATDVIWPADTVVYNVCSPGDADPEDFGMPIVTEDLCDQVGVGYEDCVFNILDTAETACFKVLRKWKITDWCRRDSNGNFHVWTKDQVIKFMNTEAPVLSGCTSTPVCSYDPNCGVAFMPLAPTATDDCTPQDELVWTYSIDAFSDNVIDFTPKNNPYADDPNATDDASGSYPVGVHRITWTVEDKCGNATTCSYTFEIQNCKLPTAICHHLSLNLALMDMDGDGIEESPMVMLPAEDVDAGSNHPCYNDVTVSFDQDGLVDMMSFDCSFADSTVAVPLYVTDPNGNVDYCVALITIQDNNDICPDTDPLTGSISGAVYTEDGEELENAEVMLMGSPLHPDMTDEEGEYAFEDMQLGGAYVVEPHKNDDVLNGVTTYDLALIQRHILGLQLITSPYKLIAADVDNSETINILDIVELRKVILGIQSEFNNNESWKFIDAAYVFTSSDPLAEPYPTSYIINSFTGNMPDVNFVGVKIGDINNDASLADASGADTRSFDDPFTFEVEDRDLQVGEMVTLPVHIGDDRAVIGYQFAMNFDPSALELTAWSGSQSFQYANMNASNAERGSLKVSWNTSDYTEQDELGAIFTLSFKALRSGSLSDYLDISSNGIRAEAYTNEKIVDVALAFGKSRGVEFALHQNTPNPFTEETVIRFELPEVLPYSLDILDVDGKVIERYQSRGTAGMNTIALGSDLGLTPGVYYYRLSAGDYSAVKKMVLLN